jgi:hypothetical protein
VGAPTARPWALAAAAAEAVSSVVMVNHVVRDTARSDRSADIWVVLSIESVPTSNTGCDTIYLVHVHVHVCLPMLTCMNLLVAPGCVCRRWVCVHEQHPRHTRRCPQRLCGRGRKWRRKERHRQVRQHSEATCQPLLEGITALVCTSIRFIQRSSSAAGWWIQRAAT